MKTIEQRFTELEVRVAELEKAAGLTTANQSKDENKQLVAVTIVYLNSAGHLARCKFSHHDCENITDGTEAVFYITGDNKRYEQDEALQIAEHLLKQNVNQFQSDSHQKMLVDRILGIFE